MNKKYIMQVVSYKDTGKIEFVWNVRHKVDFDNLEVLHEVVYGLDLEPDPQPIEIIQQWLPIMMRELANFEDLGVIIFEEPSYWPPPVPFGINMDEVSF